MYLNTLFKYKVFKYCPALITNISTLKINFVDYFPNYVQHEYL